MPERKPCSGTVLDYGFWPALPVPRPGRDREARLIRFEAGDPIFSSLNDPLLMSRITRPGARDSKKNAVSVGLKLSK